MEQSAALDDLMSDDGNSNPFHNNAPQNSNVVRINLLAKHRPAKRKLLDSVNVVSSDDESNGQIDAESYLNLHEKDVCTLKDSQAVILNQENYKNRAPSKTNALRLNLLPKKHKVKLKRLECVTLLSSDDEDCNQDKNSSQRSSVLALRSAVCSFEEITEKTVQELETSNGSGPHDKNCCSLEGCSDENQGFSEAEEDSGPSIINTLPPQHFSKIINRVHEDQTIGSDSTTNQQNNSEAHLSINQQDSQNVHSLIMALLDRIEQIKTESALLGESEQENCYQSVDGTQIQQNDSCRMNTGIFVVPGTINSKQIPHHNFSVTERCDAATKNEHSILSKMLKSSTVIRSHDENIVVNAKLQTDFSSVEKADLVDGDINIAQKEQYVQGDHFTSLPNCDDHNGIQNNSTGKNTPSILQSANEVEQETMKGDHSTQQKTFALKMTLLPKVQSVTTKRIDCVSLDSSDEEDSSHLTPQKQDILPTYNCIDILGEPSADKKQNAPKVGALRINLLSKRSTLKQKQSNCIILSDSENSDDHCSALK